MLPQGRCAKPDKKRARDGFETILSAPATRCFSKNSATTGLSLQSQTRLDNLKKAAVQCDAPVFDVQTQLMAASLIGCLGQARFPFFFWVIVTHPGHASLRSLVDAVMAPLHAYVGSDVESLALRRASRCAAAIFGFFHEPRPVRDDPVRIGWLAF
jgi:hypothetical protein